MNVRQFVEELVSSQDYRGQLRTLRRLPGQGARFAELDPPLPEPLVRALARRGIERLFCHQARAVSAARAGRAVVVATGTASGKSLAYHIPALEALLSRPQATALYLYPTKALAQDQLRFLLELVREAGGVDPEAVGTYDGDTPPARRRSLRESGRVLLTNPDMLHSGILPHHPGWARFFRGLAVVAVDEVHVYRGLFGSHVANVLRRLRRIARHWGSSPVFVLCSATVANPEELARLLLGEPVEVVTEDGSPRPARWLAVWNPPLVGHPPARRSANAEASELLARLVSRRVPSIAFGRARVVAELLCRYTRERLQRVAPSLAGCVAAYRAGYLPEHRREVERRLFDGELLAVCSTNALELGIDVGALEAALLVGFPGSMASFWQQAGRAGRRGEGLVFFIAHDQPVDQYLASHPGYLLERGAEACSLNPDNPPVVLGHLRAALYELPLNPEEVGLFGPHAEAMLQLLAQQREAWWDGRRWRWAVPGVYPAGQVSLRTASQATYTIQDAETGRALGSMDEPSAFFQLHPEAVYLHEGETYLVESLDLNARVARVRRQDLDYFTQAVAEHRIHPVPDSPWQHRRAGGAQVALGDAVVTQMVYMFKKVRFASRDSLGWGRVNLPPTELYTQAMALWVPAGLAGELARQGAGLVEGLWGLANALAGVLPLFVGCDGDDVGYVVEAGGSGPVLYLYDRHPGGAGFAREAFQRCEELLRAAWDLVRLCPCEEGCPSCVGAPVPAHLQVDPELESRGRIPRKAAVLALAEGLVQGGQPP
ncbi:MAG TPA: DEAD/DEAH box helicase, partial [Limnochordales bacterium]